MYIRVRERYCSHIRSEHDVRLEELRDTHRLESASQSEQIERLQKLVTGAEALRKANEEDSTKRKAEIEQIRTELEKAKGVAKEEEEKRTKAISLLKTVRAKLVKAEKDKDDAVKESVGIREKGKEEREKDQLDRARLGLDLERAKLEREREVTGLRAQFEREMAGLKERLERENAARKGQSELEAITTKVRSVDLILEVSANVEIGCAYEGNCSKVFENHCSRVDSADPLSRKGYHVRSVADAAS